MTVDTYYGKTYHKQTYNCAHFVCDVWEDITGTDLRHYLLGVVSNTPTTSATVKFFRVFTQTSFPVDPCIAIFQYHKEVPHVGVYLRGRLLHISSSQGVRFDKLTDISSRAKKVRFYQC